MLRRKREKREEIPDGPKASEEAAQAADETVPAPDQPIPGTAGQASADPAPLNPSEPPPTEPGTEPAPAPETSAAEPEADPAKTEAESGPAPAATESAPGPVAVHSPEPQTAAERLSAWQQSAHESPADQKEAQKDRKAASKRQRKADKAQRKADRKAAKAARKAKRQEERDQALDLDPLSPSKPAVRNEAEAPVAPVPPAPATPARPGTGSDTPGSTVDLPPITPPGGVTDRTGRRTAALVGGIDLGGTKIAAAVLDGNHQVVAYRRRPTPDRGGPADVVRAMALTMQEAASDANTEAHRLLAVGVGSPGSVDPETGAVSGAGNLPDWAGTFQLRMALQEELGTEVRVGNDVQVGTRGEFELGAGVGYSSLLGVFWGTGVGGGLIINGEPWVGRGRAGEIGHTLVRRGGAKGLNGLNGTVEAYAGRKAMEAKALREVKKGRKTKLFKLMKKHDKTHLTSAIWQRALDDGDELAIDLLNRAVAALSAGIASAVNLLDPEAVVIGGGLGVRFADTLVPEVIDGMTPYLLNKDNPPPVKVAALGDEGGVIGASLLVSDIIVANRAPSA